MDENVWQQLTTQYPELLKQEPDLLALSIIEAQYNSIENHMQLKLMPGSQVQFYGNEFIYKVRSL